MAWYTRLLRRESGAEGGKATYGKFNDVEGGADPQYQDYAGQVEALRAMLGGGVLGSVACSAVLELRVSFLAGAGVSVDATDEALRKWIRATLRRSRLHGSGLHGLCTTTEIAGQALLISRPDTIGIVPWVEDRPYIALGDPIERQRVGQLLLKESDETGYVEFPAAPPWTYVITGGGDLLPKDVDDVDNLPSTRLGRIVTPLENWDRTIYQMRRNNWRATKTTPTFKESTLDAATQRVDSLEKQNWQPGDALVVTGDFRYEVPSTGATDSLLTEMRAAVKNISAVTGAPISWLGHVDLLSNRATAQVLYDQIAAATLKERQAIQEGIREALIASLRQYANANPSEVAYSEDFEVILPLMSETEFGSMVAAWSKLVSDGIADKRTARDQIPGIDPFVEAAHDATRAEERPAPSADDDEEEVE